ncbi:MAG: hypothetical protein V2A58_15120, partial [Planctomycetota bacterium]
GAILGQDVLGFTPASAKTTVKITQTTSVKPEQVEYEVERERDAVQHYGYHYDRITIKGELRVTNYLAKAIKLEVRKALSGELTETTPKAEVKRLAKGLARMNPALELVWEIGLEAGGGAEIGYTYKVLVRR